MALDTPTLRTARLRLRPFEDVDADSSTSVLRYWDAPAWTERELREDCVVNGEVSDSWVYGLIRRDWSSSDTVATP